MAINLIKKTLIVGVILFSCVSPKETKMNNDQYKEIKTMLDSAMLCKDPIKKFNEILPNILNLSVVDTAWITNIGFFVKYKKGRTESWLLNPEDLKKK